MKRRTLLRAAAVAAGAASWPAWLRRAFASEPCAPGESFAQLAATYRRAARARRPLLLFVIPADDAAKWGRGSLFGALLNYGDDEALAALTLADVRCATLADIRRLVPSISGGDEQMMVLIETDAVPAKVTSLKEPTPALPPAPAGRARTIRFADDEELAELKLAALVKQVPPLLVSDLPALECRASQAAAALSPGKSEAALRDPRASLEGLEAPALLAARRANDGVLLARLAALGRSRLKDAPVPGGGRWARSAGCGVTLEDVPPEEQGLIMCGMGHTPEKYRRFLYFFAKKPFGE